MGKCNSDLYQSETKELCYKVKSKCISALNTPEKFAYHILALSTYKIQKQFRFKAVRKSLIIALRIVQIGCSR